MGSEEGICLDYFFINSQAEPNAKQVKAAETPKGKSKIIDTGQLAITESKLKTITLLK
jgi:hypothetical protein